MKPAQIFQQYIWIINTLRAYRQQTLEELNQKWQDDRVADGNPLQRSSFNRHRDAILSMFGIIIDCDKKTYKYYISNEEVLQLKWWDKSIEEIETLMPILSCGNLEKVKTELKARL